MRVLLVQGTSTGGVGRHVADAARGIASAGHTVLVAGPEASRAVLERTLGPMCRQPTTDGTPGLVPVDIAPHPRPALDRRAAGRLRKLARGADVVHAHGLRAGALAAVGMTATQTPLVVTLHNLPVGSTRVRAVGKGLLRIVSRRADLVLGVSEDLLEAARGSGARRVGRALIPIAPPDEHDIDDILGARAEISPGSRDPFLLLTVGRLAPQKGLDTLVDAAVTVSQGMVATGRDVVFAVAGDGPLRDLLQSRIDTTKAPVALLGSRADVPLLMRAADLLVVPSRWEGQPLVVQEGLQSGCAIVATDVGGTQEVTGQAAVLVAADDAAELSRAIVEILTTPGRLDRLRAASRRRATSLPTQEDLVAQLLGRYTDLARQRR